MKVAETPLPGVLLIEPPVFADARGYFMESYNVERYRESGVAIGPPFVQDNVSRSRHGVLRGIHFQYPNPQAKLVSVLDGEVFDVAVDLRVGSPTFGCWHGEYLSADNTRQLFIPQGFGHGFVVTSESALFSYKCSDYYRPESERTIRWDDERLAIVWPVAAVECSTRDLGAVTLETFPRDLLPRYDA